MNRFIEIKSELATDKERVHHKQRSERLLWEVKVIGVLHPCIMFLDANNAAAQCKKQIKGVFPLKTEVRRKLAPAQSYSNSTLFQLLSPYRHRFMSTDRILRRTQTRS